jgi:hypothetical protein
MRNETNGSETGWVKIDDIKNARLRAWAEEYDEESGSKITHIFLEGPNAE